MYYSADIPTRAVVDSNILLDAAFISGGFARASINALTHCNSTLITRESIINECLEVLNTSKISLGLCYDPKDIFLSYIKMLPLIYCESAIIKNKGVNNKDLHIAATAKTNGATVLTQDVRLYCECFNSDITAIFPWDIYSTYTYNTSGDYPMESFIRAVPPDKHGGLFFARVYPGHWAGLEIDQCFTVCELHGFAKICYDSKYSKFVFSVSNFSEALEIPVKLKHDELVVIYFMYDLSGKKPTLLGRIFLSKCKINISGQRHTKKTDVKSDISNLSVGHNVSAKDHWNGHILSLVVMPGKIRNDHWKFIIKTRTGGPNPIEKNVLRKVLSLINEQHKIGIFARAINNNYLLRK